MEGKRREVNQEELDPEICEKKIWKERLREEILQEETERMNNYVDSLVQKKLFEIELLLKIAGKPAKLVFIPVKPQSEEGEIVPDANLITAGNGTEPRFVVGDPEGSANGVNDGLKLGSGLRLELELEKYREHSKKNVDVECHDDAGGSKLGLGLELGLEEVGGCDDPEKDINPKCEDNGENRENDESKELALEVCKTLSSSSFSIYREHSKKSVDVECHDDAGGSKLGLGLELGLEEVGGCDDPEKDIDPKCEDNGENRENDESKELALEASSEGNSKLGLGFELDLETDGGYDDPEIDLKCQDNGENSENNESKELVLEASSEGNSESQKRKFTISKVHLRPTKKQKTREWKCTLCNVIATSETNLGAHFKGKKHIAKSSQTVRCKPVVSKSEKIEKVGNEIKLEVNGKLHVVVQKPDGIWCEICNWCCSNQSEMALHLCGSEHQ